MNFRLLFLLLILPMLLSAQTEGVIRTIPSPQYPYGLTFDGSNLWVGTSSSNSDQIIKLDTLDGSIVGSITVPFIPSGSYYVKGLAHDGQYLWVFMDLPSENHPDKFYKVDPVSGNVLKTINSPTNNYIGGMTWADNHIWFSSYYSSNSTYNNTLIKMDTTGAYVSHINTQGEQPMGVASDGQYIWCAEDTGYGATRQEIYKYDPILGTYTGEFIENPDNNPRDMTWDGKNLWLIGYYSQTIYQISTAGGTPQINIPVININFAQTTVGDTSNFVLNVNNNGTAPLHIDSMVFSNSVFFVEETAFPYEIVPGSSYNFNLRFAPTGYGLYTGFVQIYNDDPVNPLIQIDMEGKGVLSGPVVGLTDSIHNYGAVWIPEEGTAHWDLGIINMGNQALQVPYILFNNPIFSIDNSLLPIFIAPNDTFILSMFFTPVEDTVYVDTVLILTNDPINQNKSIYLEGTGVSGPFALGQEFWQYQVPDNPATGYNEYRPLGLKSIRDVTGDGHGDVLIATRNYWTICLDGFSSGNAREVWKFSSYISNYSAGGIGNTNDLPPQQKAIAVAEDLNNDGFQDVVIGTGGGNEHVYALNGVTGYILWQFGTDHPDSFGLGDMTSVYVNEDFNNDNINDVIATGSATNSGLGGRRTVYCFDGTNGQILWEQYLGCFIRMAQTIGDVNNNGSVDIVAGTGDGVANIYSIHAFDPQTHLQIWNFPIGSADGGGKEVLRYDIDGETADVIAGSYFGEVYRIDGETGTQIWVFGLGSAGIYNVSIINDVDNDGFNDILVSSFGSAFYCIGGADGLVIWSAPFGNSTWSAAPIPDITGDYIDDVVAASKTDNIYVLDGTNGTIIHTHPMNSGMLQGATLANMLPDIDNNHSFEILGASDDGHLVALSGGVNGTAVSQIKVYPSTLTFGSNFVGIADTMTFAIQNLRTGDLNINGLATSTGDFTVLTSTPFTVTAGSSYNIEVVYNAATPGMHADSVLITHDAQMVISDVVHLIGEATNPATIGLSDTLLQHQINEGEEDSTTFMIYNTGDNTLDYELVFSDTTVEESEQEILYIIKYCENVSWVSSDHTIGSVAPGNSASVTIYWHGNDPGFYEGFLWVYSNDPITPIAYVRLELDVILTGIEDDTDELPTNFALHQNYPNPFNPNTLIKYDLKNKTDVKLTIYNVLGQKVRTLVNSNQSAGYKNVVWNGLNDMGEPISGGVYIYRLEAGDFVNSHKMIFMK
jgi:outer membrane protein assembly factor BamB